MIPWDEVTIRTVPGLLDRMADSRPDRPALIGASGGVAEPLLTMNYAELRASAQRVARGFAGLGLGRGSRLGILLENTYAIEAQVSYHAAHRIGAINVPLNTRSVSTELARAVDQAGLEVIVYGASLVTVINETLALCDRDVDLVGVGGGAGLPGTPWDSLTEQQPLLDAPTPAADDDADWIFTSGTTSIPKLSMFTHAAAVACGHGVARAFSLGPSDIYQSSSPFFTSTGAHTNPLGVLVGGGTYLIDPDTDVGAFLRRAAQYGTTVAFQVTTLLRLLIDDHGRELAGLSRLRRLQYGGMLLPAEEHKRMYCAVTDELGIEFSHAMGLTEGGPTGLFLAPDEAGAKPGSIGRTAFSDWTRFEIRGEDDREVQRGEIGEICYMGPSVMRGYLDTETDAAGLVDGWLHTGDLVRQDDDGFVFFVSRKKDIIRRGGLNIAAAEVENVLRQAHRVRDASVMPKPHPVLGEDLLAVLEADEDVDIEAVREYCRQRLAPFKVPRDIRVVTRFPRNDMGRIMKSRLRDEVTRHDR